MKDTELAAELTAATVQYLRTAGEMRRAHEQAANGGAWRDFDRAALANIAAAERLDAVLVKLPEDDAARLWKTINAKRCRA